MKESKEIGIIGLGKFGMQLGASLTELGHKVIGIDMDPEKARLAQDSFTQAYVANATEKNALIQLQFQDLDTVAVSVGEAMDTSILVTLNLHELGVKNIIAKAISPAHRRVLKRLGAHHVVQPEIDVARHTAHRLSTPGLLDFLPVGGGVLLQELVVDKWDGKSLIELNLRNGGVLVAAVRRPPDKEYSFVPDPSLPLAKGDRLLIIGKEKAVADLQA